jgi:hypothetical protein
MSLLNGDAAIQYAIDRQWPPAWLGPIYSRAKAAALQNLHSPGLTPAPPGFVPFDPDGIPSGEVIDAIDKAFQGAIAEVQAMKPVPWWQRLRVTWVGNRCPPSVGITALQALLLAGAFWYALTQWQ